jgi:hypothetical protein
MVSFSNIVFAESYWIGRRFHMDCQFQGVLPQYSESEIYLEAVCSSFATSPALVFLRFGHDEQ